MAGPNLVRTTLIALLLTAGPVLAASVAVSSPQHEHGDQPKAAMTEQDMMKRCQAMMAQRQEMTADLAAMDARLDQLVATMRAAQGAAKTDAVAAVVDELVTQRKAMRAKMEEMQSGMMGHMMEHMQMGGPEGMGKSMAMCPMMKRADEKK